mmetsp:Transcript_32532/g.76617  ORF Transcript_32532/g.76617 Transcript_32532/m.76617 type:complete len:235 (+) Transcript_32532:154-858(+)
MPGGEGNVDERGGGGGGRGRGRHARRRVDRVSEDRESWTLQANNGGRELPRAHSHLERRRSSIRACYVPYTLEHGDSKREANSNVLSVRTEDQYKVVEGFHFDHRTTSVVDAGIQALKDGVDPFDGGGGAVLECERLVAVQIDEHRCTFIDGVDDKVLAAQEAPAQLWRRQGSSEGIFELEMLLRADEQLPSVPLDAQYEGSRQGQWYHHECRCGSKTPSHEDLAPPFDASPLL